MRVRRPFASDLAGVLELLRAHDAAVYRDSDWTEGDLRDEWAKAELERDAGLIELEGRLAGYAIFELRQDGELRADGYVHPDRRGHGIGSKLPRLTEQCARGFQPPTFEAFGEGHFVDNRFDPGLWWVARCGEELVGFALCDWKRRGDWGWVDSLAVVYEKDARGP